MTALRWHQPGEKRYERGVDHGVLYVDDNPGVAWTGLISVTSKSSGGTGTAFYADNRKFMNLLSLEFFEATVEAYTYPDEFVECLGDFEFVPGIFVTGQHAASFGLAYRTLIGTDLNPTAGYKVHVVYNAIANPSEKAYSSVNDSPDAMSLSWDLTTIPIKMRNYRPSAHIVLDSTKVDPDFLAEIEGWLYGTDTEDPWLPDPNDILDLLGGTYHDILTEPLKEPL